MCCIANAEITKIEVLDQCPSWREPRKIEPYCVPENTEVTHINDDTYVPICGEDPCPSKQDDCPPDFSEGRIEAVCVPHPCGRPGQPPCVLPSFPPGTEISKTVLVTLVG